MLVSMRLCTLPLARLYFAPYIDMYGFTLVYVCIGFWSGGVEAGNGSMALQLHSLTSNAAYWARCIDSPAILIERMPRFYDIFLKEMMQLSNNISLISMRSIFRELHEAAI